MKSQAKILMMAAWVLFQSTSSNAEGLPFQKMSLKQAIEKGKKTNKITFVEISATWCPPCRRMEKEVFPDATLEKPFADFVCVRLDADDEENRAFMDSLNIDGIPAYVFVSPNGATLLKKSGFIPAEELCLLANYAKDPETIPIRKAARKYKSGSMTAEEKRDYMDLCINENDREGAHTVAKDLLNSMQPEQVISSRQNRVVFYLAVQSLEPNPHLKAFLNNFAKKKIKEDSYLANFWLKSLLKSEYDKLKEGQKLNPQTQKKMLDIAKMMLDNLDYKEFKSLVTSI